MTVTTFLTLLFAFSIVSSLITESVKQIKQNFSSSLMALIISFIVGCGGTFMYYILIGLAINPALIIFAILLGLACGLCSTCGYDKVKQTIIEITKDSTK